MKNNRKYCKVVDSNIWKQLIYLAFPLICSNLFQQMYNTVDAMIVGRYIGSRALAAVGASGYIVLILIYFFMGLSLGASITISHAFGAKDQKRVYEGVHTTAGLSLISGIFLMFLGIGLCPIFFTWMNVPEEVFTYAVTYTRIYFCGMIPMLVYNMGSGILRAIGDTKTTLYCLLVSCVINIMADFLLVAVFSMGIAGAALASTISQFVAAAIIVIRLVRSQEIYRLIPKEIHIYKGELKSIIRIGAPAGLQSVVQCFSNIFVQSRFNMFGADVMAGVTSYCKIEGFIYMPMEGIAMAVSTLVGQNIGAKCYEKVKEVFKVGMILCVGSAVVICAVLYFNAPIILGFFTQEEKVLAYGLGMLYTVVPLYFVYGANQIYASVIRSAGQAKVPMIIVLVCMCGFRILWNLLVPILWNDVYAIYLCYPLSWIITFIVYTRYYCKENRFSTKFRG